jgi:phthalate 4,5-cis-dihydrodiol dehydrogenase
MTDVLRLGVIGLGGATKQMMPSLASHPRVRITAAADVRADARAKFAAQYGAQPFEDAEALCRSADVDGVYIASPHQWHKQHVLSAAAAGKHIIVEKPMALSLADCDAMIGAVERAGVRMVVGHTASFNPPVLKMREIVRAGTLGRLAMINTWYYGNFLYRPRRPEELDTAQGGGIIYNQVPHQVDMVRLLGGGMVKSVRSMAWRLDPARPTEGSHLTFLQFEDGAAASLAFSGYDHFDSDEFHFWIGEGGEEKAPDRHGSARAALKALAPGAEAALKTARLEAPDAVPPRWHHMHSGVTLVSCEHGDMRPSADGLLIYDRDGRREIPIPRGRAFPDKGGVIDELYDAVTRGREPLHNGRWGKATMEVCEAVLTSARERREIILRHQVAAREA